MDRWLVLLLVFVSSAAIIALFAYFDQKSEVQLEKKMCKRFERDAEQLRKELEASKYAPGSWIPAENFPPEGWAPVRRTDTVRLNHLLCYLERLDGMPDDYRLDVCREIERMLGLDRLGTGSPHCAANCNIKQEITR